MTTPRERFVWLLLLAATAGLAAYIGYGAARQKYQRQSVGNLNQVTLITTKALWLLRERPEELPAMLEATVDWYSSSSWDSGRSLPEVTNTLALVKKYRATHQEYSPDAASEQGRRFQRTQEILKQIAP